MRYLMGVDNGGTFSKAAIFSETGEQIASASERTEVLIPAEGWRQRDMENLWEANARVIRKAIENSGLAAADIKGVSFSGHGKGLYLIDRAGNPLGHGILSTDTRAAAQAALWQQDGTAGRVYAKTFQKILPCQPVTLLAWMKKNQPLLYKEIGAVFAVKDYIRYRLTGEAYGEYSDFSGSNLVNLSTGAYDAELLGYFGLEDLLPALPPLRHAAELCGRITSEAAAKTGLAEGTAVAAGMFDIDACGIASGLADPERLCMIAGTWSINEYIAKEPVLAKDGPLNSCFCMPGYYLVEESSPTSAGNMEWFLQSLMKEEQQAAAAQNKSVYDLANAWAASVSPEESDVLYLPYLNGAPGQAKARGTFLGLSMHHEKRHMLRAVYEGVVFSHAAHVQRLLRHREKPAVIQLSGGAANSAVWVQIFADVLQIPVEIVGGKELGAQGAAMAAGICCGVYQDFSAAIEASVHFTGRIEPRKEYAALYQKKYQRYEQAARVLDGYWELFGETEGNGDA